MNEITTRAAEFLGKLKQVEAIDELSERLCTVDDCNAFKFGLAAEMHRRYALIIGGLLDELDAYASGDK